MQDGKHVILCVDDDPDILESLKVILEANDYIVELANSAEEGLHVYKKVRPDLLIIDLIRWPAISKVRWALCDSPACILCYCYELKYKV